VRCAAALKGLLDDRGLRVTGAERVLTARIFRLTIASTLAR